VLKERLSAEYGLPIDYEPTRFSICRWIAAEDRIELDRFVDSHLSSMARDLDGAPVFMAAEQLQPAIRDGPLQGDPVLGREGLSEEGGLTAAFLHSGLELAERQVDAHLQALRAPVIGDGAAELVRDAPARQERAEALRFRCP
jgi:hypothetical protein